jgi:ATP/maltotriose-dependent transcriptional regulator MalT
VANEAIETLIAEGREAFERGDAVASRQAFENALAERETGEVLEGLARALHLAADYAGSIDAHERAFAAYKDEDDALGAARAARILSWLHGNVYGDWAVASGWLARAERLLEQAGDDSAERGWVEVLRATGEPHGESREKRFRVALELGKRFGDTDLEFEALSYLGLEVVIRGRVEEGMLLLDEALAAVCAGEVYDLYCVEGMFCGMFVACERTQDVVRAEQWIRAARDIVERRRLLAIGAFCRAHYGGILTAAGRWEEAETVLQEAARIFEGGYTANRAGVLIRLADLRVRQGRLEEAALLLEGMDQHRDAARPLAALHLARGDTALARDVLERKLAEPDLSAPTAAGLLALLVDVRLSEDAVDGATEVAERLAEIASREPSHYIEACAALAKGKLCVASASGDARSCLRDALAAFSLAQMPVELARARLELARAVAQEQPEVAVAEAKAALEAFELRQAARDADAAASLLRSLGAAGRSAPKRRSPLTKRESEVLKLLGHGLSNPEIAKRLFISNKTAEHHVGKILSKLGVRNRAEAAAYAARMTEKD